MRILLSLLLAVMTPSIVPASRLCLPIGEHPPPIEYALNKVQDAINQSGSRLEISCSQPDYQLFYEVDNAFDPDDFILVVTDVELIITSGSARGITYGLMHLLDQLCGLSWEIRNLHSSVAEMKARIRAISIPPQIVATGREYLTNLLDEMIRLRLNALVVPVVTHPQVVSDADSTISSLRHLCVERGLHLIPSSSPPRSGDTWSVKTIEDSHRAPALGGGLMHLKNESEWLDLTEIDQLDDDLAAVIRIKWPKSGSYGTTRLKPYWDQVTQQIPKDSLSIVLDFPPVSYHVDVPDKMMMDYGPYFTFWSEQFIDGDKISESDLWNKFTGSKDSCLSTRLTKNRQMVSVLEDCLQAEDSDLDLATMHRWRVDEWVFADVLWFVRQVWKMERKHHFELEEHADTIAMEINHYQNLLSLADSVYHSHHKCNYKHLGLQKIDKHSLALGYLVQYVAEKWLAARELIQYGISRKRKHRQIATDRLYRSKLSWSKYWNTVEDLPGVFSYYDCSQEDIIEKINIEIAVVSKLKPSFLGKLMATD